MRWFDLKPGDVVWDTGIGNSNSPPFLVLSVKKHLPDEDTHDACPRAADVEIFYLEDLRLYTFRGMCTMWRSATVLRGRTEVQASVTKSK